MVPIPMLVVAPRLFGEKLARTDIATMQPVGRSLMPEGLLDGLSDQELRDLFAYLRQSQPITPQ